MGDQKAAVQAEPKPVVEIFAPKPAVALVKDFAPATLPGPISMPCADCPDNGRAASSNIRRLQRSIGNQAVLRALAEGKAETVDPAHVERALGDRSNGQALEPAVRQQMEVGLGQPLDKVRVHRDEGAAQLSSDLQARAFTRGQDIYFARGTWQPETREGKQLLAHELVHTLQPATTTELRGASPTQALSQPSEPAEVEAETIAARVVGGLSSRQPARTAPKLGRQTDGGVPPAPITTAPPPAATTALPPAPPATAPARPLAAPPGTTPARPLTPPANAPARAAPTPPVSTPARSTAAPTTTSTTTPSLPAGSPSPQAAGSPVNPAPNLATVSPDAARRLAYAATVLARTPRQSPEEQRRLDQIIRDTPVYSMIQERNAKREQIESDRQWVIDYQNRNAAIARGETLSGGTGASQQEIDRLNDEIATLTPQVDQLNATIQANLAQLNIDSEQELIRVIEEEFPQKWITRAKQIASAMLDENKANVEREKARYAANVCSPDINGLREADQALKQLSDRVTEQENQVQIVEGAAQAEATSGGIPDPSQVSSSHYDIVRLPQMRDELEQRRSVLRAARQNYGAQYKILLLDNYSPGTFVQQSDEALVNLTGTWLQDILDNIETTRENINQERIKVWNLRDVPELTYQNLGIEASSVLGAAVNRYIRGQVSDEQALHLALTVLQIGAVIVATVVAGPLGGALVGGALTLNQLMMDVDRYLVESAASRVALDPTIADISVNEPELLPIVMDILSLGLDVGMVVAALRPAARLLVATGEATEYAAQARRVAPEAADELIARANRRAASGVLRTEQTAEAAEAAQRAEREVVAGTANRTGEQLTARELQSELDVVGRSERRAIAEGEYIAEVDLGNGHRWKLSRDGRWCRFSNGVFCVTHLAFGGEGAALDQTLRLGPRAPRPTPDELSGALERLRAGRPTPADQEILLRQTIADTRAYLQADVGRPLSWDAVAQRCGPGRDVSAASFGSLAADSPRPLSIYRFQSQEVFGVNKHGFNVVTFADGKQYLVDPTFGQFLRPTGAVTRDVAATAERLTSDPQGLALARSLTENGFVPLTPENARLYARGLGVAESDADRLAGRLFRGENTTFRDAVGQGRQSVYRLPASGPDILDRSETLGFLRNQIRQLEQAGDPNGLLPQLRDLERNLQRTPPRP